MVTGKEDTDIEEMDKEESQLDDVFEPRPHTNTEESGEDLSYPDLSKITIEEEDLHLELTSREDIPPHLLEPHSDNMVMTVGQIVISDMDTMQI